MRKSELKTYSNRYNRLPRVFVARHLGFIYLRGSLSYEFWTKWSKVIKPCSLLDRKIIVGRGFPRGKVHNSYGRRLWQRHVTDYYLDREFDRYGFDTHHLPFVSWSFQEHKDHCLGVKLGKRLLPVPNEAVLLPLVFHDDLPF